MDLQGGNITLREILKHRGTREILAREFPELYGGALFKLAQGMSLNTVLAKAGGHAPREQIQRVLNQLKAL